MKNTPVKNIETTKPNTQTGSSPINNPWVVTIGIFAASFCICYITHETTKRGCSFELKYKDLPSQVLHVFQPQLPLLLPKIMPVQ